MELRGANKAVAVSMSLAVVHQVLNDSLYPEDDGLFFGAFTRLKDA